jgi:glycosyltransferase involved in cell wall biosynthesis
VGKVTDEDLAELYSKATAFVFPSEFEGFGLPPLEALQAGCPVISSDAGPMPEVLGKNGVVYFKSGSQDGIIRAVKAVVDNLELLKQQAELASKELAIKHSWKSAAKLTLQAYSWVLKNK